LETHPRNHSATRGEGEGFLLRKVSTRTDCHFGVHRSRNPPCNKVSTLGEKRRRFGTKLGDAPRLLGSIAAEIVHEYTSFCDSTVDSRIRNRLDVDKTCAHSCRCKSKYFSTQSSLPLTSVAHVRGKQPVEMGTASMA